MGAKPQDGAGPWKFPTQGRATAHWDVAKDTGDGNWEYPPLGEAMLEAGFEGIGKYTTRRQNTGAHYIATLPIMDLCERSDQKPGARVSRLWW